ncbi:MAG: hypothetical protein FRX49_00126 [Trebouxia sp. A1-2]|nr:MAG: hypothetical protein FRX49_00126 [Trebouxia sp. A1-2]
MTFQVATSGAHHSAMQPDVDKGGELRQAYPLQDKARKQDTAALIVVGSDDGLARRGGDPWALGQTIMYQQLLVVLLSVYLTKPHLRTMPAFACKTHGPVTTRQNFKQQQGWCEEQNSTMSRTAKLAEGMDWTRVGEGASSAKAKSCVLVPCVGCSSMYLSERAEEPKGEPASAPTRTS